eukprot:762446-Hanusia_phi.AAC.3
MGDEGDPVWMRGDEGHTRARRPFECRVRRGRLSEGVPSVKQTGGGMNHVRVRIGEGGYGSQGIGMKSHRDEMG